MSHVKSVEEQVLATSKQWIETFNKGDAKGCSEGYVVDAVMDARPVGQFVGRESILAFWQQFIQSTGASELIYKDVNVDVLDENNAVLSANWQMNVGRGYISKELWQRQGNGQWLLVEDDFTVVEQF
ncbi:YybH family protein [Spartinivicinus poritis]|uniref:DUF4440 domain-containing protein n=1 Tax=Spartinivicinus poritis TaxID=2994640 RepID=A0ABT5U865_9GAMM|nr:nuclear transport factor 2 family protein [Spartinivicinus sp. A2-2]MDE1461339.1 DUF4440 domain-containing protein [Spartinivicinus sp. A2-2]